MGDLWVTLSPIPGQAASSVGGNARGGDETRGRGLLHRPLSRPLRSVLYVQAVAEMDPAGPFLSWAKPTRLWLMTYVSTWAETRSP